MNESLSKQKWLLALIGVITTAFIGQKVLGGSFYSSSMVVPVDVVYAWEQAVDGSIKLREFFPLLSYAFLHGDTPHLVFNMLFLWIFGALAVELLGSRWMLVTFVFTALCGGIFHVMKNADSYIPMLGASGAVMGFEGLYLGMAIRWHLPNPHIWPMSYPIAPMRLAAIGVMGLVLDYMGYLGGDLSVAYSAHLGGFVGGVLLGALVVPMPSVAHAR